jgi:hypothetical protein
VAQDGIAIKAMLHRHSSHVVLKGIGNRADRCSTLLKTYCVAGHRVPRKMRSKMRIRGGRSGGSSLPWKASGSP